MHRRQEIKEKIPQFPNSGWNLAAKSIHVLLYFMREANRIQFFQGSHCTFTLILKCPCTKTTSFKCFQWGCSDEKLPDLQPLLLPRNLRDAKFVWTGLQEQNLNIVLFYK